ncbi:MAG TPA: hypothetical protein VHT91_29160 [Kofleriaceae bacterium]|jgi:hypothetical protein|nr:hypothetical protein [Kofleriaceae bacterium]
MVTVGRIPSNPPAVVDWARTLPGLAVITLGAAGHHARRYRAVTADDQSRARCATPPDGWRSSKK